MAPPLSFRTDPKILKPREAAQLAKQAGLKGEAWKGLSWTLPCFAAAVEIVELSEDAQWESERFCFLKTDAGLEKAEYRAGYAEELAQRFGLALSRDTADEYLRLYLALTRGQAGLVTPVEQVDHLPLREELTLITRRKLQSCLTPLTAQDSARVTGCFLIGDKLFSARAAIGKTGAVSLEPLALIADTLPVLDSVLEG